MVHQTLKVDVALVPSEAGKEWQNLICIVVDVLRCSSTLVTLFEAGCPFVYTASSLGEARSLARKFGLITVGERNAVQVRGFDFGNSPADLMAADLKGKGAVLTTTNGTAAVRRAASSRSVLIGCYRNALSCAEAALALARTGGEGVGIICSGWKKRFCLDDALCAGFLVQSLLQLAEREHLRLEPTDSARAAALLQQSQPDIQTGLRLSDGGRRLLALQREQDLSACSRANTSTAVPLLTATSPCRFEPFPGAAERLPGFGGKEKQPAVSKQ